MIFHYHRRHQHLRFTQQETQNKTSPDENFVAALFKMDSTRALLDELMGKDRNVPLSERKVKELRFTDSIVCKYELAGLCPFTLFKNTKSDLGKHYLSPLLRSTA